MERRFNSRAVTECRVDGTENKRITGYASVFYDGTPDTEYELWDDTRERIMPGAFDRAIAEDDVRALFNHDANMLLGRNKAGTLSLRADKTGLAYDISPPDTEIGRSVAESIKRGDLSGSSFAFIVDKEEIRSEGKMVIREVKAVRLFDVGPVTYPAYNSTDVAVRSMNEALKPQAPDYQRTNESLRRRLNRSL